MQKAVDDVVQKTEKAVYVLNFRYIGGCKDPPRLERKLNRIGWQKVADLTSVYATKADDNDLHQGDVERFLREHVAPNKPGASVRYGISKYIPPNQRPDNYEGIDTLFDEQ